MISTQRNGFNNLQPGGSRLVDKPLNSAAHGGTTTPLMTPGVGDNLVVNPPAASAAVRATPEQHLAKALQASRQTPGLAAAAMWQTVVQACQRDKRDLSKLLNGDRRVSPLVDLLKTQDAHSCAVIGRGLASGCYGMYAVESSYGFVTGWQFDAFDIELTNKGFSFTARTSWQVSIYADGSWFAGGVNRKNSTGLC